MFEGRGYEDGGVVGLEVLADECFEVVEDGFVSRVSAGEVLEYSAQSTMLSSSVQYL